MTAWEVIRKLLVDKHSAPGTVGRVSRLQRAGELYFALREHLSDLKRQDESFDADVELCDALLNDGAIETMRGMN